MPGSFPNERSSDPFQSALQGVLMEDITHFRNGVPNRNSQEGNRKMETEYDIVYVDKPEQSAWGTIGQAISNYNAQQAGDG